MKAWYDVIEFACLRVRGGGSVSTSSVFMHTHGLPQDWFSGRLKQVVLELTSDKRVACSPQDSIDGASMSVSVSDRHPIITDDLELLEYVFVLCTWDNGFECPVHLIPAGNSPVCS